jgi:HD-GYP domain-containing protein (c-di-GMP phosphodiesterase class II)
VFSTTKMPRLIFAEARPKTSDAVETSDAWDVLARFTREAPRCAQTGDLISLGLRAAREAIHADTVYWYPGRTNEEFQLVGRHDSPPEWYLDFAQKLLQETPGVDHQLLRTQLPGPRGAGDRRSDNGRETLAQSGRPRSAAMVRVSKSQYTWLVALSFDPNRLFQPADVKILSLVRQVLINQQRRMRLYSKMTDTMFWLVHCLTAAIDTKAPYWSGHSERVGQIAARLGRQMRLPEPVISDLYFAGLLHDLGRRELDDELLLKPGRLTEDEFAEIRKYPVIGDRLMADIKQLEHLRPAVRNHHERFDGQGYPDRIAGQDIPLLARVVAVADAVDAMMSVRPHRPALAIGHIEKILAGGAGTQWDPSVVDHFMACRADIYAICQKGTEAKLVPAVEHAVAAWDLDSSGIVPVRRPEPEADGESCWLDGIG